MEDARAVYATCGVSSVAAAATSTWCLEANEDAENAARAQVVATALLCLDVMGHVSGHDAVADVLVDAVAIPTPLTQSPSGPASTVPTTAAVGLHFDAQGGTLSPEDVTLKACARAVALSLWLLQVRDDSAAWLALVQSGWLSGLAGTLKPVSMGRQSSGSSFNSPVAVPLPPESSPSTRLPTMFTFAPEDTRSVDEPTLSQLEKLTAYVGNRAVRALARLNLLGKSTCAAVSKPVEAVALSSIVELCPASPGSAVWAVSRFSRLPDLPDENKPHIRKLKALINTLPSPFPVIAPPSAVANQDAFLFGPQFRVAAEATHANVPGV